MNQDDMGPHKDPRPRTPHKVLPTRDLKNEEKDLIEEEDCGPQINEGTSPTLSDNILVED
jgi:hypothetical protein